MTLLLFSENASVKCKTNVFKELVMNLLASTQVFCKKNKLSFEFLIYLTSFCKPKTYSD